MSLQFSADGEKEFLDIVGRYPTTMAALLPALHLAQKEFGWISVEVMEFLANRLDLPPSRVLTTATFYSMYNKTPVGKCHVQVCTTLSCAIRGGYELVERLENKLDVRLGETDADGNFTLSEVECLASCGTAPMFQVSDSSGALEFYEDLEDEAKLDEILEKLKQRLTTLPDPRKMH